MINKTLSTIIVLTTALTACAKSTSEISAQYISPIQYQSYSCQQIEAEMQAVSSRVTEVGGHVDKTASDDKAQAAVGIILFWPTLFLLDGNSPQAAEYARLKGEFDALEKSAIQKNCMLKVNRPVVKVQEPAKQNISPYPSEKNRL